MNTLENKEEPQLAQSLQSAPYATPPTARRTRSTPSRPWMPPVHCGWGAPAEHCGEPPAQPAVRRSAAQSNRLPGSERAGQGLTRLPGPALRGVPASKPKTLPFTILTGPEARSTLPLAGQLLVTLFQLLGPSQAAGAIPRRAGRSAHWLWGAVRHYDRHAHCGRAPQRPRPDLIGLGRRHSAGRASTRKCVRRNLPSNRGSRAGKRAISV